MDEDSFSENASDVDELYEHHRFLVDKGQTLLRIDKFLLNRLENVSRNRIQNAAIAKSILVNKVPVKSSYKVKPDDVITIVLAYPPRELEIIAQDISLDIVFEDEDLIVINKAAGMVVHPGHGNYTGTMVNALAYHFHPELKDKSIESESERPGLVHRIDKHTTGLLVVSKNEKAMTHLAKQFFDRTIDRKYIALVWGDLEQEKGTITGNIGRNLTDRKMMDVFEDKNTGKHAVTHYKVLKRYGYVTLVECKLETGRTHQIRVHFKYIGNPLFNDETYGGKKVLKGTIFTKYKQFVENCFTLIPGQALHARSLGLIHPTSGNDLNFEVDLPKGFQQIIEKWETYTAGSR